VDVKLTDFNSNPLTLNDNSTNLLNQNPSLKLPFPPLPSLPSIPDQNLNDFLNSCNKILDKQTCDFIIPNK
jgi:hypothetical protein